MVAALFPGFGKGAVFAFVIPSDLFRSEKLVSLAPFANPAKGAAPTDAKQLQTKTINCNVNYL